MLLFQALSRGSPPASRSLLPPPRLCPAPASTRHPPEGCSNLLSAEGQRYHDVMGSLVPLMMVLPCELHKHKQDFALRTKGGGRRYQDKRFSSL